MGVAGVTLRRFFGTLGLGPEVLALVSSDADVFNNPDDVLEALPALLLSMSANCLGWCRFR